MAILLLLPGPARAGNDIVRLRTEEILEIEIQAAESRRYLPPATEASLQLWMDFYREMGVERNTFHVVHERFALRRFAGGRLVRAEKRFDPHRLSGRLIDCFNRREPDTAGIGRIRWKIPDPVRLQRKL